MGYERSMRGYNYTAKQSKAHSEQRERVMAAHEEANGTTAMQAKVAAAQKARFTIPDHDGHADIARDLKEKP